jgi:hypothetical protein
MGVLVLRWYYAYLERPDKTSRYGSGNAVLWYDLLVIESICAGGAGTTGVPTVSVLNTIKLTGKRNYGSRKNNEWYFKRNRCCP